MANCYISVIDYASNVIVVDNKVIKDTNEKKRTIPEILKQINHNYEREIISIKNGSTLNVYGPKDQLEIIRFQCDVNSLSYYLPKHLINFIETD